MFFENFILCPGVKPVGDNAFLAGFDKILNLFYDFIYNYVFSEINDRDFNEIETLEKGGPIAIADYFIVNKGSNLRTRIKIDKILKEINF